MALNVDWTNPYAGADDGLWLRGNLHAHAAEGSRCSSIPTDHLLARYAEERYDFLAVSDHMNPNETPHPDLIRIPGVEWNSPKGEHAGVVSLDETVIQDAIAITDQETLLRDMAGRNALVILNHPNWQLVPHYRREQLMAAGPFDGVEIYNAVIERLPGSAIATDKWDVLLFNGRRVLGFASDDSHSANDVGRGWITVRAAARSAEAILEAIQAGRFYASSGVTFTDIRRDGPVITIESENAQEFHAIIDGGRCMAQTADRVLRLDTANLDASYIRFAAYGPGSTMAWTQPFFLKEG